MFRGLFSRAVRFNERGIELQSRGWLVEAEAAYRQAADADPHWAVPWYNLGLMFKRQRQWRAAFEHTQHATRIDPTDGDTWWNLGIAATALGEWVVAREAWTACGVGNVPEGTGPIEMDLGPVPIRLTDADNEVLWARRIDPARAVLMNVPLPKSGYHWQDLVLHDGAVNGYRTLNGQQVPVFDALERISASSYATFIAELDAAEQADIDLIESVAEQLGGAGEDWSSTTRILCKQCGEGSPHNLCDNDRSSPAHPHCGIAAKDDAHMQSILAAWSAQVRNGRVLRWYPA